MEMWMYSYLSHFLRIRHISLNTPLKMMSIINLMSVHFCYVMLCYDIEHASKMFPQYKPIIAFPSTGKIPFDGEMWKNDFLA